MSQETIQLPVGTVSKISLGLMGMTWKATPPPRDQSIEAMKAGLDNGINFWNGGLIYGTPEHNSLHLLNDYFTRYPEDAAKVVISIKSMRGEQTRLDGSAANTRRSIDEILRILDGKKKLDIWEPARVDPKVPIELTVRAANEYVKAGKLGGISLSECSADSIRRAAKEVKIVCVEVEFSLWETTILTNGVAKTCAELNIPIIAYSPLGKGFLTGQIKSYDQFPEDDVRRLVPRFQGENFDKNLQLVHEVEKIAQRKGCTAGQIAIAWVLAQSDKPGNPTIIPLPGASRADRVKENATIVKLTEEELQEIDNLNKAFQVSGDRYPPELQALTFGNSPPLEE